MSGDNRQNTGVPEVTGEDAPVHLGVLVAPSPRGDAAALVDFADAVADRSARVLSAESGREWRVHREEPQHLRDAGDRRPSDFLDEAGDRIVRAPYDILVVVTDVRLRGRRHRFVPGVASDAARVAVLSTHRLRSAPRDEPVRRPDAPVVVGNGAALLTHLLGHVAGLSHARTGVMAPFDFDPDRTDVPDFGSAQRPRLAAGARRLVTGEPRPEGALARVRYYGSVAVSNWRRIGRTLLRNRAPLLSLSLPTLTSAAVIPTLILVFSAETWDVGVHLTNVTAIAFFFGSIVAASAYLVVAHGLLFPREPGVTAPRQLAVVNLVVAGTMVAAVAGLFAFVATLMLLIELVIFPQDLITTWPSLEDPVVRLADLVRTAGFISALGVLTGALAGGLESRTIIHHLALFRDRP